MNNRTRLNRRVFLKRTGVTMVAFSAIACGGGGDSNASENNNDDSETFVEPDQASEDASFYQMPDEGEHHSLTWMAYGATEAAWGTTGTYGNSRSIARKDLIRIAANLSRFEPVNMLVSNSSDLAEAEAYFEEVKTEIVNPSSTFIAGQVYTGGEELPAIEAGGVVQFIVQPVDDLWMRDTGPVFVWDADNSLAGVNFNFNGWGQEDTGAAGWTKDPQKAANGIVDQTVTNDQQVADFILNYTGATPVSTWLVMEGGGIEVNGLGTAICTESSILNDNRNPGATKAEVEEELERILGVRKVIWLEGIKAIEITDGHVDFYARFVGPTTVVYALDNDPESPDNEVTLANQEVLNSATDADGTPITPIPLHTPDFLAVQEAVESRNWDGTSYFDSSAFAAGYVGFYLANSCVLMSQFGDDEADQAAFDEVQRLFPNRIVIQITTDGVANGGGSIHCATQQQIGQE